MFSINAGPDLYPWKGRRRENKGNKVVLSSIDMDRRMHKSPRLTQLLASHHTAPPTTSTPTPTPHALRLQDNPSSINRPSKQLVHIITTHTYLTLRSSTTKQVVKEPRNHKLLSSWRFQGSNVERLSNKAVCRNH